MKLNLDFLKFSDKKSKRSKKSGIERKLKKEVDETFTWKNIWKHFALFCMFFGFILKNLPVIHKIPLPFLGSVGGLGSLIFLVSALYLAYKHRDVVTIIFAMLKFFVIALISLLFMLLTGGVYYFFRRSKIDKDIRQGLDITGLPKNMSGGGRRQKFSSRRKQKGGATSENSSELQQERMHKINN